MTTLQIQRLRVHLADGRQLETEARNPDYIRWELTAAKERWPIVQANAAGEISVPAPMLLNTFLAWASLTRTGAYDGKWAEFNETHCLHVEPIEAVDVDPTQLAPDYETSSGLPSAPESLSQPG